MFKSKNIKISELALNTGQVPGLPKNPRFIRDNRFKDLVKSIQDAPEMLDYRKLLVYPFKGKYVVLCGNMRLRACKELGYKEMPCMIVPEDTDPKKLREYTQKDNVAFGQNDWDALANEWDVEELQGWGVELQGFGGQEETDGNASPEFYDDDNQDDTDFSGKNVEVDVNDFEDKIKIGFSFTDEEWAFVNNALQHVNANKEIAILTVLGYYQQEDYE